MSEYGVGWPLPLKALVTVCLIGPAGFSDGHSISHGPDATCRKAIPQAVRWAWAFNAAASVLGSAAAICLAIYIGLRATVLVGALLYLCALSVVWLRKTASIDTSSRGSRSFLMKFARLSALFLAVTGLFAAPSLEPPKLRLDGSAQAGLGFLR